MSMQINDSRERLNINQKFWRTKTTFEKTSLILIPVLAVCLLSCVIVLATRKSEIVKATTDIPDITVVTDAPKVCKSDQCKNSANTLLAAMDQYTDPCEDFYAFACGRWKDKHEIRESEKRRSQFSTMGDQVNNRIISLLENKNQTNYSDTFKFAVSIYNTCNSTSSDGSKDIVLLKTTMKSIFRDEKWPLIDDKANTTTFTAELFGKLLEYQIAPLFNIFADPDSQNNTKNIIKIYPYFKTQFMVDKSVLLNSTDWSKEDKEKQLDAYKNYIKTLAKFMAGKSALPVIIDSSINDVISFESDMAKWTIAKQSSNDTGSGMMTVNDFANQTNIPQKYVVDILDRFAQKSIPITEDTIIYAGNTLYMTLLFTNLLDSNHSQAAANYLYVKFLHSFGQFGPKELQDAYHTFENAKSGAKETKPSDILCSSHVNSLFMYSLTGEYAKQYFPPADKKKLQEIMKNIVDAFDQNVDALDWMDKTTKVLAIKKAKSIIEFMAHPEWVLSNTKVDAYYKKFLGVMDKNNSVLENTFGFIQKFSYEIAQKLNRTTSRSKWDELGVMSPLAINAYYDPTMNNIHVLLGILGGSFYNASRHMVLNYGGIGMVMGHELTHGFDNQGRQYDYLGNKKNWWTKSDETKYNEKAECFVKQYSLTYDILAHMNISGIQTLGENIADNGGIREAFVAYKTWVTKNGEEERLAGMEDFTIDQLYFLNWANSWCENDRVSALQQQISSNAHSPAKYRINLVAKDFDEFSKAFNCKNGSKMNPAKKCKIW